MDAPRERTAARTRRRWTWIVLLGLVAAVGHWLFHYAPRLRAAAPGDDLTARLASHPDFDHTLWVPTPHQTLRALERRIRIDAETVRAGAAAFGLELPGSESPRLPPARSMAVAASDDGTVAVAVRLYPLAAGFARLAGALADNPWLAGGSFVDGDRPIQVDWRGRTWLMSSPHALDWDALESVEALDREALATLRTPWLGRADLRSVDRVLELATDAGEPVSAPRWTDLWGAETGGGDDPVLVAWSSAPRRALFLAPPRSGATTELPRTASLSAPGEERWRLPLEGLLEATGRAPAKVRLAGWEVVASDAAGLEASRVLAAALDRRGADLDRLQLGVWLELERGGPEIERLARQVESSPLVAASDRRRARAARRLAGALAESHRHAELAIERVPPGGAPRVAIRLVPR